MTNVLIKDVNQDMIAALEALAKCFDKKCEIKQTKNIKVLSLREEVEQIKKDYLAGKISGYKSAKQMHEEILNG